MVKMAVRELARTVLIQTCLVLISVLPCLMILCLCFNRMQSRMYRFPQECRSSSQLCHTKFKNFLSFLFLICIILLSRENFDQVIMFIGMSERPQKTWRKCGIVMTSLKSGPRLVRKREKYDFPLTKRKDRIFLVQN